MHCCMTGILFIFILQEGSGRTDLQREAIIRFLAKPHAYLRRNHPGKYAVDCPEDPGLPGKSWKGLSDPDAEAAGNCG